MRGRLGECGVLFRCVTSGFLQKSGCWWLCVPYSISFGCSFLKKELKVEPEGQSCVPLAIVPGSSGSSKLHLWIVRHFASQSVLLLLLSYIKYKDAAMTKGDQIPGGKVNLLIIVLDLYKNISPAGLSKRPNLSSFLQFTVIQKYLGDHLRYMFPVATSLYLAFRNRLPLASLFRDSTFEFCLLEITNEYRLLS